jgi:hypothetical protein
MVGSTMGSPAAGTGRYQPGVCNIGPAEIARRRMAGHVGAAVAVILFIVLVALHAPPITRLLIILPAAVSASGYLQAHLHFCAGFGARGIFNFGDVGTTQEVADPEARARDRAMSRRISFASLGIGVLIGVIAVLLPL